MAIKNNIRPVKYHFSTLHKVVGVRGMK